MFVVDELDTILANLATKNSSRQRNQFNFSLPDIERINVDQMRLDTKVAYKQLDLDSNDLVELNEKRNFLNKLAQVKIRSTDSLFLHLITQLILSKLTLVPEHQYPSAKLIVCDSISYDLLIKLRRISTKYLNLNRNFIYKNPFNVTAIILVSDLVDMFDHENQPIIVMSRDTVNKREIPSFNYNLLKKVFPYIKMCDLFIIKMNDKNNDQFNLDNIDLNANKEIMVLQYLKHFARSTNLIEMNYLLKLFGKPHSIYDNVLTFEFENYLSGSSSFNNKLTFNQLTYLTEKLVQLSIKLDLKLTSVSYRLKASEESKLLSQFILSAMRANIETGSAEQATEAIGGSVLVLDRAYNIQMPLYHSDRYGAFLEQMSPNVAALLPNRVTKSSFDTVDVLDENLYLCQLTEVLETIVRHSLSLKTTSNKPISTLAVSQSIKRHLELNKLVYKCLNEGYLMVLKIEAKLEIINNQLHDDHSNLKNVDDTETEVMNQLRRVVEAIKQLITRMIDYNFSLGSSVDLLRISCILFDLLNKFTRIHPQIGKLELFKLELKSMILSDKNLKKISKSSSLNIIEKLNSYDKLSTNNCNNGCLLKLEKIIELMKDEKLPKEEFLSLPLNLKVEQIVDFKRKVIIIIFLGFMSAYEISRLKLFENRLRESDKNLSLIILNCGQLKPEEFLKDV